MIIGGKRRCGKTTELIKIASEEHLYIVCADRSRVEYIAGLARQMELDIPFPISVSELPLRSPNIKQVLVDDIEDVLSSLINKPVYQATSSLELKSL
jgi:hypothetical protein